MDEESSASDGKTKEGGQHSGDGSRCLCGGSEITLQWCTRRSGDNDRTYMVVTM